MVLGLLEHGYAQETESALVDTVIAAIQDNYSKIHTVRASIRSDQKDSTVDGVVVEKFERENVTTIVERRARSSWLQKIIIDGHSFRTDSTRSDSDVVSHTLLFTDGYWTSYTPSEGKPFAMIRAPEDMASVPNPDPREIGATDIRRPFVDALRTSQIASAEYVRSEQGGEIIKIITHGDGDMRTVYEFRSQANFLPTRSYLMAIDDSIVSILDITYQDVLDGNAKFLKSAKTVVFRAGAVDSPDDATSPIGVSTVTVDSLLVNEPVGIDEFSLVMSEGTRVSDGRRHTIYYAASTPPLAPSSLRFVVVLIPVLIGMAVVLTLIIRHRAIALKSC